MIRTHKASGWTREPIGWGRQRITPTDESGIRIVDFVGRGRWGNLPNDDQANIDRDRVILIDGSPLPEWAAAWLLAVHQKHSAQARAAFQSALNDADWNEDRGNADNY